MSQTQTARRPSAAARRTGYVIAAGINAVLLWLIHGWPGWDAVPFLTQDMPRALVAIDASLIAGIVANVIQVWRDPPWMIKLCACVTLAFGLASLIAVYQVFPFSFGPGFDWALLARILLILAIVGTAIALAVTVIQLAARRGMRS
jgi:hypothetical protein